jgi:hypothetical protein
MRSSASSIRSSIHADRMLEILQIEKPVANDATGKDERAPCIGRPYKLTRSLFELNLLLRNTAFPMLNRRLSTPEWPYRETQHQLRKLRRGGPAQIDVDRDDVLESEVTIGLGNALR